MDFDKEGKRKLVRERGSESVSHNDRTLSSGGFGRVSGSVGKRRSRQLEVSEPVKRAESPDEALAAIVEGERIKAQAKARLAARKKAVAKERLAAKERSAPRKIAAPYVQASEPQADLVFQQKPYGVLRPVAVEVRNRRPGAANRNGK